jgi:hypothetical protein
VHPDGACGTRRWWRDRGAGRRKDNEGYVLQSARLNLARTVHACRIAVQKQADHHLRCVSRLAAPVLLLIRLVDGAPIRRRNHIDQKPRKMVFGKPIVKGGWKYQCLVDRVREKVLAHESNLKQILPPTLSDPSRIYARHTPKTRKLGELRRRTLTTIGLRPDLDCRVSRRRRSDCRSRPACLGGPPEPCTSLGSTSVLYQN